MSRYRKKPVVIDVYESRFLNRFGERMRRSVQYDTVKQQYYCSVDHWAKGQQWGIAEYCSLEDAEIILDELEQKVQVQSKVDIKCL